MLKVKLQVDPQMVLTGVDCDRGAACAHGAPDDGRCSGAGRADGERTRTALTSSPATSSHVPSPTTLMPAPQRSGQLSSFAAALLHSSLLRAADALLVPSSGEYELTAQTAAAYSTVCQQPCHLCAVSLPLSRLTCVCRRQNPRPALSLHGLSLGPSQPTTRSAQKACSCLA